MSTTKKPTGIIYRAKNTISGKSYIGQTTRTLSIRKKEHINRSNRQQNYKFANALICYPETSWEWSILAEVEVEKLNEYELFFINELDTFNNGYNSLLGVYEGRGNNCCKKIYELYHADHGFISGTRQQLKELEPAIYNSLSKLLNGKNKHIKGWVLKTNATKLSVKERNYDIFEFYHIDHGVIQCTRAELREKYLPATCSVKGVFNLTSGRVKKFNNWVMAENKEIYNEILGKVTLQHPSKGTFSLTAREFNKRFGLTTQGVSHLKTQRLKSYKGWTLVEEK